MTRRWSRPAAVAAPLAAPIAAPLAAPLAASLAAGLLFLWASAAESADVLHADVHHKGDHYFLSLKAYLDAPPTAVFAVITDYDHVHELHRRVRESRVVRRLDDHTAEVYTRFWGCLAGIFCKGMEQVERVEEVPPSELHATVIPEQSDLKSGTVSWRLAPDGDGTLLSYDSRMDPDFWVPPVIGDGLLKRSISRTTLEMIRRVEERALELAAASATGMDAGQAENPEDTRDTDIQAIEDAGVTEGRAAPADGQP